PAPLEGQRVDDGEPPGGLYYLGIAGVLLGGTALAAGGLLATLNELTVDDPNALAGTKRTAQSTGLGGIIIGGVGALVAAAGAVCLVVE
ncbi:MAG TPA: hypothetical protein VGO62_11910, partial [Myxococcota bacterium]